MRGRLYILLTVILLIFVSLLLSISWRGKEPVQKITVIGNYSIPREDLLFAARLNDSLISNEEINIDLIQDRISKHPEVKKVFVSRENPEELKIEIVEKRPVAILNGENEIKLVDDEPDVFPLKVSQKIYDLPVISGVRMDNSINQKSKYNKEDLRLALYIILNAYKESKYLYNSISEINLSDSEKVIVYLSEDSSPVYLPRGKNKNISDAEYRGGLDYKMKVFDSYIRSLGDNHLKENVQYVDLRFSNQIIVNSTK
ncbi:MAG: Cell division protein FtsQ [Ignavibacteria bacterium]|nr:Cell division protein FtsQ [Ignavibacteria bacterium]